MMFLFIAVAAGVLLGSFMLWLSGYYTGQTITTGPENTDTHITEQLQEALHHANKKISALEEEVITAKSAPAVIPTSGDHAKDNEIATLSSELAKAEGERDKALVDLDNVKDELEKTALLLKQEKTAGKPKNLPKPKKRENHALPESEVVDQMQASLDMEKVSHQQTREEKEFIQKSCDELSQELTRTKRELEQVKKLAAVKTAATSSTENTKGTRFKTMGIGMRSPFAGGADQDLLRVALDKVQIEKDRVESELERAKKEIQLLKMRS